MYVCVHGDLGECIDAWWVAVEETCINCALPGLRSKIACVASIHIHIRSGTGCFKIFNMSLRSDNLEKKTQILHILTVSESRGRARGQLYTIKVFELHGGTFWSYSGSDVIRRDWKKGTTMLHGCTDLNSADTP